MYLSLTKQIVFDCTFSSYFCLFLFFLIPSFRLTFSFKPFLFFYSQMFPFFFSLSLLHLFQRQFVIIPFSLLLFSYSYFHILRFFFHTHYSLKSFFSSSHFTFLSRLFLASSQVHTQRQLTRTQAPTHSLLLSY